MLPSVDRYISIKQQISCNIRFHLCYTEQGDVAIILCACIRDASSSNLFWGTRLYRLGFSSFSLAPTSVWIVPRLGNVGFLPGPSHLTIRHPTIQHCAVCYNNRVFKIRHKTTTYLTHGSCLVLELGSCSWYCERARPVMGKLRPAGQIRPPEMFYPARATLFLI